MRTVSLPVVEPGALSRLWTRLYGTNRWLALSAAAYTILFCVTFILAVVDTRLVTDAPVWFKPMKFALSSVLYTGTLAWILSFVESKKFWVKLVGTGTAMILLAEVAWIVVQAFRGVRSHFNFTTVVDGAVFSAMGSLIAVAWVFNLIAAVLLLRQKFSDPVFAWSLRLALILTAVGASLGAVMTRPTGEQLSTMQAGVMPQFIGAHNVGVADGGEGLPFTGWSTEGGDLRIAHFIGLHALQFMPVLGLVVNQVWGKRVKVRGRTRLIFIGGLGYLGLTLLVLWQALRGQPLLAPDGLTLAVLGGILLTVVGSAAAVIHAEKRSTD